MSDPTQEELELVAELALLADLNEGAVRRQVQVMTEVHPVCDALFGEWLESQGIKPRITAEGSQL